MAKFATGKYALAVCDRCGFQIKYLALKTEWNGRRVCDECFDEKHPQLGPFKAVQDAQALYQPNPDPGEGDD